MWARRARHAVLALLAALALDLADGDCAKGLWAGEVTAASATEGCACCVPSEAAPDPVPLPSSPGQTGRGPGNRLQTRAGVHPIPYRPPISLS
jgi:hypothetical protein